MIRVRFATSDDLGAMSRILVASITALCGEDHHDDPAVVAGWTANKSVAALGAMLGQQGASYFVAEQDGRAAGVGCIIAPAEIGLNYVAPEHRFSGVSSVLLGAMEEELRRRGITVATLNSTATAHWFYLGRGWSDAGAADRRQAVAAYPMRKTLG